MSAIAGIYCEAEEAEPISRQGGTLMQALRAYPADDSRCWQQGPVFLGCHAQWITPESVLSLLPYYDAEKRLAITADAILDNRRELFEKLNVGQELRAAMSDSELILLAYVKWGEDAPKHFAGDFAFMIWDESRRRLFGARDFSGGRTLYYSRSGSRFAFCTIMEPLLRLPGVNRQINDQWMAEYLAITGMIDVVSASSTIYQAVEQVPPAHCISVTASRIELARYVTVTPGEPLRLKRDEEYVEAFRDVFREAVASRLRTRKGVAAQLSGGLDSGAVVSFAARELKAEGKPLHTFSYVPVQDFVDFTSRHYMADESPYIEATARYVGGGVKAEYCDFAGKDSFSEIGELLPIMEMPYKFFENSFWLKGMFEKASEAGAGILLNGGRGNLSISWGPAYDYYAVLLRKFRWLKLARELHQFSLRTGGSRLRSLPDVAEIAYPSFARMRSARPSFASPSIVSPRLARKTGVYEKLRHYGIDESGWLGEQDAYKQRRQHFEELFYWNASNTLACKLSLPYGVWKRDPTNDLRVIRFCLSVPEDQYVMDGMDRALVRRATESYLPDTVRLNQRVQGIQGADWVHRMLPRWTGFLNEVQELTADERALQYLNGPLIQETAAKVMRDGPRPDRSNDLNYRMLMRSVIVYRFLKTRES
ncbi:asparagine synthase-related protein [Paenibacillus chartarius]|uniref:asparagine synthase (glutamine-hydrolyzing) n=1 Tax=Paenibacillus chartarius TaxID=747481 RepID=A0ABV6DUX6_9BACL